MGGNRANIAVIYLLRKVNGELPVKTFLESYLTNKAGVSHELVILFKGFCDDRDLAPYQTLLKGLEYQSLRVSDRGFDINAYFKAAKLLPNEYLCFLNSYTQILHPHWLAFFWEHLSSSHLGAVGATGSWESLAYNLSLPHCPQRRPSFPSMLAWPFKFLVAWALFPGFPNPHLRTTGFLCRRHHFLKLHPPPPWWKLNAMIFESGRWGFSRQLRGKKLEVAVINSDNQRFLWPSWPNSRTYRTGQQEKLLLADNRTHQFAQASPDEQRWLATLAWGKPG